MVTTVINVKKNDIKKAVKRLLQQEKLGAQFKVELNTTERFCKSFCVQGHNLLDKLNKALELAKNYKAECEHFSFIITILFPSDFCKFEENNIKFKSIEVSKLEKLIKGENK